MNAGALVEDSIEFLTADVSSILIRLRCRALETIKRIVRNKIVIGGLIEHGFGISDILADACFP